MIAKIDNFQKSLLDHEDLASNRLYVSFKNNFEQSFQNTKENIYLPYMRILYLKSLFKMFMTITFLAHLSRRLTR